MAEQTLHDVDVHPGYLYTLGVVQDVELGRFGFVGSASWTAYLDVVFDAEGGCGSSRW